ncbi:hypothetical protein [Sphingomonas glacialis]|uniref:hypothetical protein n=1 Tax=Sphingomonas glacialis TaxID=658225 RepID=UPI00167AE314|nr:hypothetical protein [Sphingomonas glacialis]
MERLQSEAASRSFPTVTGSLNLISIGPKAVQFIDIVTVSPSVSPSIVTAILMIQEGQDGLGTLLTVSGLVGASAIGNPR